MSFCAAPAATRALHVLRGKITFVRAIHSFKKPPFAFSGLHRQVKNRPLSCAAAIHRPRIFEHPSCLRSSFVLNGRRSSSFADMEMNGDARPKRKHSPVQGLDRPAKHLRPDIVAPTPGDTTPQNGTVYDVENDLEVSRTQSALTTATDSPEWQATIEKVVKSVVSIHFCQTCSFDTDLSMSSQATGFVVDAVNGYILTNRHVVCAGPFSGYCIFDNHEEVSYHENKFIVLADLEISATCSRSIEIQSMTSAF